MQTWHLGPSSGAFGLLWAANCRDSAVTGGDPDGLLQGRPRMAEEGFPPAHAPGVRRRFTEVRSAVAGNGCFFHTHGWGPGQPEDVSPGSFCSLGAALPDAQKALSQP